VRVCVCVRVRVCECVGVCVCGAAEPPVSVELLSTLDCSLELMPFEREGRRRFVCMCAKRAASSVER
jgi:hypothetical protein